MARGSIIWEGVIPFLHTIPVQCEASICQLVELKKLSMLSAQMVFYDHLSNCHPKLDLRFLAVKLD